VGSLVNHFTPEITQRTAMVHYHKMLTARDLHHHCHQIQHYSDVLPDIFSDDFSLYYNILNHWNGLDYDVPGNLMDTTNDNYQANFITTNECTNHDREQVDPINRNNYENFYHEYLDTEANNNLLVHVKGVSIRKKYQMPIMIKVIMILVSSTIVLIL